MNIINELKQRPIKYIDRFNHIINEYLIDIKPLEQNGYLVIPQVFSEDLINSIYNQFNEVINSKAECVKIGLDGYFIRVMQPFLNCDSTQGLLNNKYLLHIVLQYFSSFPYLFQVKLQSNGPQTSTSTGTSQFHRDPEAPKLLKAFVYLTDTDMGRGPFTYVKGSHLDSRQYPIRVTDKQVIKDFGKENIIYLTAKAGDLIVADTHGLHKGMIANKNTRTMLTMTFLNNFYCKIKDRIKSIDYNQLDEDPKILLEYLQQE